MVDALRCAGGRRVGSGRAQRDRRRGDDPAAQRRWPAPSCSAASSTRPRILVAAREREVADRDAHIFELERRLADMQQQLADQKAEAQRRWMLGIPHTARRVRNKLASPKETSP